MVSNLDVTFVLLWIKSIKSDKGTMSLFMCPRSTSWISSSSGDKSTCKSWYMADHTQRHFEPMGNELSSSSEHSSQASTTLRVTNRSAIFLKDASRFSSYIVGIPSGRPSSGRASKAAASILSV